MTLNSFFLILANQLKSKWGRFILASGGIMIGVWAISLTTGLSIGLRDTLIQAINSRPEARFLQIYKSSATSFNFTDINAIPSFNGISTQDIENIKKENPEIVSSLPSVAATFAFRNANAPASFSCNTASNTLTDAAVSAGGGQGLNTSSAQPAAPASPTAVDLTQTQADYSKYCQESYTTMSDFTYLYDVNRAHWIGSTDKPTGDNIVLCYTCGSLNLGTRLGYSKPEDMLNKQIEVETLQAPDQYVFEGENYEISNGTGKPTKVESTEKRKFTIAAVIDDREPGLNIGFSNIYLPPDYFVNSIKLANPDAASKEPLFVEYSLFVKDFSQLKSVTKKIDDKPDYLATALVLFLVNAINNLFLGLTVVLSLLGFIAFVASIFGIITVMFISVLERKKEIGILKSLGARDRDIFLQFLLESSALGVVGWLSGTILAIITSLIIQGSVYLVIQSIQPLKDGLNVLNIDGFAPSFPWWLYLGTFGLAVFFTSISGIVPSFSAARQNPVDVLRSE